MSTTQILPHWNMDVIYPGLNSAEFEQDFAQVVRDISDLAQLSDAHSISKQPSQPLDETTIATFETVMGRYNSVLESTHTFSAYLTCLVSTNSQDTLAQARKSELQQSLVTLSQLGTRLTAWIGSLDVEALISRSTLAREHAFMLRKTKIRATHLMTPPEEVLASELSVTSSTAWSKLHGDLTSQLLVPIELHEQKQELPMSMIRNMADDPNREVRYRAYEAELGGWQRAALPLAAALK